VNNETQPPTTDCTAQSRRLPDIYWEGLL
jgi:hypothetical protein